MIRGAVLIRKNSRFLKASASTSASSLLASSSSCSHSLKLTCNNVHNNKIHRICSVPFTNTATRSMSPINQHQHQHQHQHHSNSESIISTALLSNQPQRRYKSTASSSSSPSSSSPSLSSPVSIEKHRLHHLRNVGVFAHVDAGKTTVTERMLALAGIVQRAGSVDTGNTVTDYLPAERERGITIQSAAISFNWQWLNNHICDTSSNANDDDGIHKEEEEEKEVTIQLIDTPGHVDFSVEVNRSVAVLDGAVLVIDAVAGVQAQTETVWRAMTMTGQNNTAGSSDTKQQDDEEQQKHQHQNKTNHNAYGHEPLPCIAFINKMDKEGCNFAYALSTLKHKLPNANPIAIQIPLFKVADNDIDTESGNNDGSKIGNNIIAVPANDISKMNNISNGHFVGVIDLIDMRAIIWPDHTESSSVSIVEECIPDVFSLTGNDATTSTSSQIMQVASSARMDLVAALADVDEVMEEYYLMEEDPSNNELRSSLRKATLSRTILPVMTGAALRGRGVEPLLDAVADYLPSPIERLPPSLIDQDVTYSSSSSSSSSSSDNGRRNKKKKNTMPSKKNTNDSDGSSISSENKIQFGHPLHPSLLALAFKVVHMKNKGSGDGRVVFARVYSGKITARDTLKVVTPAALGEAPQKARTERVGGMLELAGGRFDNLKDGVCLSGDVCALVGLKSVVTGDTLLLASDHVSSKKNKKKKNSTGMGINIDMDIGENVCLAGVASPKPVLTVRMEAESAEQQAKLSEALKLLNAEDPSLHIEETDSATLLSGLGELHIEVVVDRLQREHGLSVWIGKPAVAYRETTHDVIETSGLVEYDRTIGATRLQAAIHLLIEPIEAHDSTGTDSSSMILSDPVVTIGPHAREYLGLNQDSSEEELAQSSEVANALIAGCKGALMRGPVGSYGFANAKCTVVDVDAEGGLSYLTALPGALRAAASSVLSLTLAENKSICSVLEPTMNVEITAPTDMVGLVLSDLTSRRGTVGDVFMGDSQGDNSVNTKALVQGEVPLVEILGYANSLRSLTGGEGAFTAEYVGHSPCEVLANTPQ